MDSAGGGYPPAGPRISLFLWVDLLCLKHYRYALREQVERVEGDWVTLNVLADELLKC